MTEEKKEQKLLQMINIRTKDGFETLLIEHNICPLCVVEEGIVSDLVNRGGERVCEHCGFVSQDAHLNFAQQDGAKVSMHSKRLNALAFNRGLGGTLGEKGLFCVLAKGPKGVTDLPVRARQISIITQRFELPQIRNMLQLGNKLCKEWGFADDPKRSSNFIFSNYFGRVLRRIGAYMILADERISQKLVNACFAFSLKTIKGEKACNNAMRALDIDFSTLETIMWLYNKTNHIQTKPNEHARMSRTTRQSKSKAIMWLS